MPFGWLVPVYWNYFEPNTLFAASSEIMARFAPMVAPLMHRVNFYTYWFECPLRLLMNSEDFENFITGGQSGDEIVDFPKYKINSLDPAQGYALLDYMGVPQLSINGIDDKATVFDAPPFRAYIKIWNEYFRDQNTTEEIDIPMFTGIKVVGENVVGDNTNNTNLDCISIKSRCYEKDYFTSALPFAQRGTPVKVPFTVASELAMNGTSPSGLFNSDTGDAQDLVSGKNLIIGRSGNSAFVEENFNSSTVQVDVTPHTKIKNTVGGTINDLRTAFSLQRWYERNAVGGARYIEQINSHFGVWADDYRLQRPKYLGGARTPLAISEVLQTSASQADSAQGTMSGRGFTLDKNGFVKTFVKEHSIIMCIICCVPKPAYFQGMPRKLNIRDRFDFVWPELANLGEQAVERQELFYAGDGVADNKNAFGYQSRYAQYKYEPNEVHGYFRDSLLFWHLGRKFDTTPHLNRNFLTVNAERDNLNRIFAVENVDSPYYGVGHPIWCQMAFNIRVKRPLPYFGTPR